MARARASAASGRIAALGAALSRLGLRESAVCACFRTASVANLPFRLPALARRAPELTPAAVLPWLLVAGRALPLARVREVAAGAWGEAGVIDELLALGLVAREPAHDAGDLASAADRAGGDTIRARMAVVPIGAGLIVCDRLDAPPSRELVAFPDESAFHLIASLPARRVDRWLDVGTGCGIVPLAARGRARAVLGTDVNPRALAMAQLGAWLSGAGELSFAEADLLAGAGAGWDLITFNAPIPEHVTARSSDARIARMTQGADAPLYYRNAAGGRLLDRFWTDLSAGAGEAGAAVARGGEVLVHSWQPRRGYPGNLGLPGRVAAVCYTPDQIDEEPDEEPDDTLRDPPDDAPERRGARGVRQPDTSDRGPRDAGEGDGEAFGITAWRPSGPSRATRAAIALSADRRFVTRADGLED